MKMNSEGSYFTPNDGSINDTIKVMEEIVKDIAEGNKISIGIDCNANNYYSDQVLKYEMDTFKAPIENDLLIDFYFKFITDHPLVTYLEDPIATSDIFGWKKIISKFEEKPNCIVSMKNTYNEDIPLLKKVEKYFYFQIFNKNDLIEINEDLTQDEKDVLLEKNRIIDEENSKTFFPKGISMRVNEFVNISEVFEAIGLAYEKLPENFSLSVWDNNVDSDNNFVIDLGFGMKAKNIFLNAFNTKTEKINKINKYIKFIEDCY